MPVARWSMAYALEAAIGIRGRRRLAGRLRIEGLEELEGGRTAGGWWRTILRGGRCGRGPMDWRFGGAGVGAGRLRPPTAKDRGQP